MNCISITIMTYLNVNTHTHIYIRIIYENSPAAEKTNSTLYLTKVLPHYIVYLKLVIQRVNLVLSSWFGGLEAREPLGKCSVIKEVTFTLATFYKWGYPFFLNLCWVYRLRLKLYETVFFSFNELDQDFHENTSLTSHNIAKIS